MLTPHAVVLQHLHQRGHQTAAGHGQWRHRRLAALVGVGLLPQRRLTEPRIRVNSKTSDIVVLWLFLVQLVLGVATVPISVSTSTAA